MGNVVARTPDQKNADIKANIVQLCQEVIAVAFQLVCLSRIETTTDFIKPTLVLFLTLVVFTGPYLNTWLLLTENIIFKGFKDDVVMAFMIALAHVLGSLIACGLVGWWEPPSTHQNAEVIVWNQQKALTWNMTKAEAEKAMWEAPHWYVHFVEESFAVGSFLIGCAYLLWLRETRRAKPKQNEKENGIQIEMKFYLQLTLLVAAASQAFPSAQLSVHILCYKLWMQTITGVEFFARLLGGLVGLFVACLWCKARESYRKNIQNEVSPGHEHYTKKGLHQAAAMHTANYALLPPIRLSMQGASYF